MNTRYVIELYTANGPHKTDREFSLDVGPYETQAAATSAALGFRFCTVESIEESVSESKFVDRTSSTVTGDSVIVGAEIAEYEEEAGTVDTFPVY